MGEVEKENPSKAWARRPVRRQKKDKPPRRGSSRRQEKKSCELEREEKKYSCWGEKVSRQKGSSLTNAKSFSDQEKERKLDGKRRGRESQEGNRYWGKRVSRLRLEGWEVGSQNLCRGAKLGPFLASKTPRFGGQEPIQKRDLEKGEIATTKGRKKNAKTVKSLHL